MGEFRHEPVMLKECINGLKLKPGQTVVDATLGGAGHSAEIARKITGGTLIGIDRDSSAIEAGGKVLGKVLDDASDVTVYLIKSNFADIENVLQDVNIDKVNGILADLGVSSHQIDSPERGFSYMRDADLDMRMDTEDGHTAADIVNEYPEKKLADIIFRFGEERYANRIASAIVANRPVTRTLQLAEIIKAAVPAGYGKTGGHPAKRTFQSIRIAVNRELESIEKFLPAAVAALKKGGRLAVITFHSLEDRIVKQAFKEMAADCICDKNIPECVCGHRAIVKLITKKPITPTEEEIRANPRSSSAKLRIVEALC